MRTTALFAGPAKLRARTRSATRSCRAGSLEDRLSANDALWTRSRSTLHAGALATLSLLEWPCLSVRRHGRCGTRRWRGVNRARPRLRRNHSPLRNNGLLRCRFGRRSSRSLWLRARSRRGRLCWSWRRRFCRWRRDHSSRRLGLSRWRRHHHGGRRCRFFCGRRRWRRNDWRRLSRRRHNNGASLWRRRRGLCLRRRHDCGLLRRWRRRRSRNCLRCARLYWRRGRRTAHRRRCTGRRSGRMLLLLLTLLQQLQYVSGLGDLGKINLRFDLRLRGLFPGGAAGPSSKMLADLFGFVFLNGA